MKKYGFGILLILSMFLFSTSLNAAYYHYQVSANPGDISGQSLSATNTQSQYHTVTVEAQAWTIGDAGATAYGIDTQDNDPYASAHSHADGGTVRNSDIGYVDGYVSIWLDAWAGNGMSSAHVNITW